MTARGTVHLSALALAAVLVVGVTGGAVAGSAITGADIKNSSLTGKDVKNGSLTGVDLNAGTLGDLEGDPGPRGPAGPAGPSGPPGATGAQGAPGPGAVALRYDRYTGNQTLATVNDTTFIGQCAIFLGPAGSGSLGVTLRAEGPGVFQVWGTKTRSQGVASTPTTGVMDWPSDQFGRRDIGGIAVVNNGAGYQTATEDGTLLLRFPTMTLTVIYHAQVVYDDLDSRCTLEGTVIPSS